MAEITIPADQPDASFMAIGNRYCGIYRLPFGSWRQLVGEDKQRLYFSSAQEATRAAMAKVNAILFRPIRAEDPETDPAADALTAEITAFQSRKAMERAEVHRLIHRGGGKPAVVVETKRRRAVAP